MEHDARFRSGKNGVLIAVVIKYVCSDFSMCHKDFSRFWQVELGSPQYNNSFGPNDFNEATCSIWQDYDQCDEKLGFTARLNFAVFVAYMSQELDR